MRKWSREKQSHQRLTRCHELMGRKKDKNEMPTHTKPEATTPVRKKKWGRVWNKSEKRSVWKESVHVCGGFRKKKRKTDRERWWKIKRGREWIPSTEGWDDGGIWDSGGRGHISEGQSKAGTGDCHVWWLLLLYTCSSTLINFGYANQPYCIMASLSSPTDKRMFSCWI